MRSPCASRPALVVEAPVGAGLLAPLVALDRDIAELAIQDRQALGFQALGAHRVRKLLLRFPFPDLDPPRSGWPGCRRLALWCWRFLPC